MGEITKTEEVVDAIRTVDELKSRLADFYVIDNFMTSYEDYSEFQEKFYTLIKGCYEHRALRKYPVKFKFYNRDMEYHTLELRHFIINLFYWYPFVELHNVARVMDEDIIIDCYTEIPKIDDRINQLIGILRDYNVKSTTINYNISHVLYNLRRISGDFSMIMGLNFDMFMIFDLYDKYPEFRHIMEDQINDKMQPSEIEEIAHQKQEALIKFFTSLPENPIGVILKSGTGIKHKQLQEFFGFKGLIPDISGATMAMPIKGSNVLRGLQTPSDLYIDGSGARKSVIMSHKVMGRAGHFGKTLTELSRTVRLSKTVSDCDTKHLVKYFIINKAFLRKLDGRFFTLDENDWSNMRPINAKKDTDLLGKTVFVRSPCTCALKNEICAKCFGTTANLNFDIANGIGAFSSEEISKVIEQNILSTKHLLTTSSEKIEFDGDFDKFFTINSDEINPIINESEIDDLENWAISINKDDLMKDDEMDDDEGFNTYIQDGKFTMVNTKTGEIRPIQEKNKKDIFLTDDALQLMKKYKGYIPFKAMDDDMVLFVITILNNELTKPLYELMNLINRDKGSTVERSINAIAQRFIELLVESKIGASAVAAEIIINRLIRKEDCIYDRPDFSSPRMPKYKIVTMAKALEWNRSPLVGLSYQYIKRQLLNDNLLTDKYEPSYLDPFFKETIDTRKRKAHLKHERELMLEDLRRD